ncbi:MAG: PEP-CTERM sorting domain-containing protein [Verrucomicrobia bacterium]|nr:PEP-CTERM sorting domain-containing protein [Verrucomicrobiota bacterium]
MKKNILAAVAVIACAGAMAQGTLNLSTTPSAVGSSQVVTESDGVTKLTGPTYVGQLYAGATEASLAPIGNVSPFLTGSGAGYWRGTPNPIAVPGIALGGSGFAQLWAWDSSFSSFDAALAAGKAGKSEVFAITTGGHGEPPAVPDNLVNFKGFSLIPEPSTIALGLLGAASLLFFRRK